MKKALLLCLLLCLAGTLAQAQRRHKKVKEDRTERGLVYRILGALHDKDQRSYLALFPDIDTFNTLLLENLDSNSRAFTQIAALQENATQLLRRDSLVSARLEARFDSLIRRGEAIGIEWKSIVPLRYELMKRNKTRDTLLEKLMPERFVGYAFFMDLSSRQTYCVLLSDIFRLKDRWYGGQLGNVFEARNTDEYLAQAAKNQKRFGDANFIFIPQGRFDKEEKAAADSTATARQTKTFNQVVSPDAQEKVILERKYYKGYFDEEIPVQLYMQSLKGDCPEKACLFEAMYVFGDQPDYIRLQVKKTGDNTWEFTDPRNEATMELHLTDTTFYGDWLLDKKQTGYDVELKEAKASPEGQQKLDAIMRRLEE